MQNVKGLSTKAKKSPVCIVRLKVCTMDGYPSERFDAKVVKIVGRFEADPRLGFEIDVVFVI